MPVLQIPVDFVIHFAAIRDLGPTRLNELVERLRSLDQPPLDPNELGRELKDLFGEHTEPITQQLMALSRLRRERRLSPDQLVDALTNGLISLPDEKSWNETQLNSWRDLRPQLQELFSVEAIDVAAKAFELAFEYA